MDLGMEKYIIEEKVKPNVKIWKEEIWRIKN